jgi:hypothetical protein
MECGVASIYTRARFGFLRIALPESTKQWQDSFLYTKNVDPANDQINLLVFVNRVPARVNWGFAPPASDTEVSAIATHVRLLKEQGTLTGPDLVATFVERRVLPLASRTHKIGLMSGSRDPTRFSTKTSRKAQVIH